MDYIKLTKALTGSNNVQVKRKTATATADSVKGKVTIDVGGNKIDVPVIGTVKEGETVVYTSQDGAPIAYAAPGSGDTLQAQVDSVTTLIRETERGVEVGKSADGKTFTGIHTAQTASAFEVHGSDTDHTVLASFGADTVNLANTNQSAVINMIGGVGKISAIRGEVADDAYIVMTGSAGAQLVTDSSTTGALSRVMAIANSSSGAHANMYSEIVMPSGKKRFARLDVIGGSPSSTSSQVAIQADTVTINDNPLTDHITQSYASGNWYVERYASGLVKQYWYGNATYINGTAVILTQSIPVSLSKVYAAHVTPTDYRVSKVYYMPSTSTGTLTQVMIGGTATEAHTSPISITLVGKA